MTVEKNAIQTCAIKDWIGRRRTHDQETHRRLPSKYSSSRTDTDGETSLKQYGTRQPCVFRQKIKWSYDLIETFGVDGGGRGATVQTDY